MTRPTPHPRPMSDFCECENVAHDEECSGTPSVSWPTIYGRFDVCAECDTAHRPPADFMREAA